MFLIDKYNVKSLDDVILHKNIYKKLIIGFDQKNKFHDLDKLQKIIETKQYYKIDEFDQSKNEIYNNYNSMPNLLIHGPSGCGKHTLLKLLLDDIYDSTVNNITTVKYNIYGYGNKVVEVDIKQSKYHLIIEPNNTALDKYLIQEVVKEYAKKKIINVSYNKFPFRTVLINNVDNLNYLGQTSLRCTMERYHKTCRFILCGNQISKIIDPIRSRCLDIRIPSPNPNEIADFVYHVLLSEKKLLSRQKVDDIVKIGNGNIKKTLWILQMSLYGINNFELSWEKSIDKLVELMIKFKEKKVFVLNIKLIPITRNILYNIFTTNIPSIEILHVLIEKIISSKQFSNILLSQIMSIISETEIRINKGTRSIIHLDSCMCKIYKLIYLHYHNE
jgi:replication factor C subunit 3/5